MFGVVYIESAHIEDLAMVCVEYAYDGRHVAGSEYTVGMTAISAWYWQMRRRRSAGKTMFVQFQEDMSKVELKW